MYTFPVYEIYLDNFNFLFIQMSHMTINVGVYLNSLCNYIPKKSNHRLKYINISVQHGIYLFRTTTMNNRKFCFNSEYGKYRRKFFRFRQNLFSITERKNLNLVFRSKAENSLKLSITDCRIFHNKKFPVSMNFF